MTTVKVERLENIEQCCQENHAKQDATPSSNYLENISQKRMDFKPEIDVRGLRGDEALMKVSEFIDNAVMLKHERPTHLTWNRYREPPANHTGF